MMLLTINVNGKELEVKFTFNSFKYMEELDITELTVMERKPFKIISIGEMLLMGAMNHDPKNLVAYDTVQRVLEDAVTNGEIVDLIGDLVTLLTESDFFKALQTDKVEVE